jgi:hypothetical protein
LVQRKRSQRKRSQRKRSQRKRSQRKRSQRKRIQKGGGIFEIFKTIKRSELEQIAYNILKNRKVTDPIEYVIQYSYYVNDKYGLMKKPEHIVKGGIFGILSAGSGAYMAVKVATRFGYKTDKSRKEVKKQASLYLDQPLRVPNPETGRVQNFGVVPPELKDKILKLGDKLGYKYYKYKTTNVRNIGLGLTALAIIGGLVYSNIRKYKKRSKMILDVCTEEWNSTYPNKQINRDTIERIMNKDPYVKIMFKSVKKASDEQIKHAVKTDKLMISKGEFHGNSN